MHLLSLHSILQKLEISVSETTKELSSLNSKKAETFGNIATKVFKISSDICNKVFHNIWNSEILGRQNFRQNLKLADITPAFKKKDPTLAENYRPVALLDPVSKMFERIIQKQLLTHIERFLSPYLCEYRKGFSTQFAFISLIEKVEKVSR